MPSYPKLESFHGSLGMGMWVREMSQLCFFSWVGHSWAWLGFCMGFLPRKWPLSLCRALEEKLEACRSGAGVERSSNEGLEGAEQQDRGQEGPGGLRPVFKPPGACPQAGDPQDKNEINVQELQEKMLCSIAGRKNLLASEQCGVGRSELGVCVHPTPFLRCSTAAGPAGACEVLAKVAVARVP